VRHLSESGATIAELRRYIADKEINLQQSVNLIAEKDQALGYQQATIARLEEHVGQLQEDAKRMRTQLDSETSRLQLESDRLRRQVAGLEEALHTIQSKFLYRVYRKFTGK